jgi:endonuclease/exonuclease/phosphatase family metal-dependent hydrolase
VRLRVLTLNVLNLEGDPRRQKILNAEIRRLDPDLISLQEVILDEERDQLAQLLDGTGLHGTHQARPLGYAVPWSERYGGTALATRWPHTVVETLDLRLPETGDVHPWGAIGAVVDIPGEGELLFVATTNGASLTGELARERHVVKLAELDERHRRKLPTIIAGDFNARPDASSIRFMRGLQSLEGRSVMYNDAWEIAGRGPGFTWEYDNPSAAWIMDYIVRQPTPRMRIDYVFVGSSQTEHLEGECRVQKAELAFDQPIDGIWPSDHYGVLVDLEVSGNVERFERQPLPWTSAED